MMLQDNHIHTNFSDGRNTPEEMVLKAIELGFSKITFTDHVRRDSDWVWKYIDEISRLKEKYRQITILVGIECKVVDHKGTIDCSDELLRDQTVEKIAAIHRIPKGNGEFIRRDEIGADVRFAYDNYLMALEGISKNELVSRIAHPFSLFTEFQKINVVDWDKLYLVLNGTNKRIEYNVKYDNSMVPSAVWSGLLKQVTIGSDSHSVDEMAERQASIATFVQRYMEERI